MSETPDSYRNQNEMESDTHPDPQAEFSEQDRKLREDLRKDSYPESAAAVNLDQREIDFGETLSGILEEALGSGRLAYLGVMNLEHNHGMKVNNIPAKYSIKIEQNLLTIDNGNGRVWRDWDQVPVLPFEGSAATEDSAESSEVVDSQNHSEQLSVLNQLPEDTAQAALQKYYKFVGFLESHRF